MQQKLIVNLLFFLLVVSKVNPPSSQRRISGSGEYFEESLTIFLISFVAESYFNPYVAITSVNCFCCPNDKPVNSLLWMESLIVALSGSFDVTVDDGINKKTIQLNRPYLGLNIKPGMWRDISNFSSGSVLLVLASSVYTTDDYIMDYDAFKKFVNLQ